MNSVNITGNITKNPECRYTTSDNPMAVLNMTVAINEGYGEKKQTQFVPCVVYGKQAENCERYLSKGSKVEVTGRIRTGSYEKDGRTIYTTEVVAERVGFLDSLQK